MNFTLSEVCGPSPVPDFIAACLLAFPACLVWVLWPHLFARRREVLQIQLTHLHGDLPPRRASFLPIFPEAPERLPFFIPALLFAQGFFLWAALCAVTDLHFGRAAFALGFGAFATAWLFGRRELLLLGVGPLAATVVITPLWFLEDFAATFRWY